MAETPYPPGARIVVRDAEWIVRTCTITPEDGYRITGVGASEFVRDETGVFFTKIESVDVLEPEKTELELDGTPEFAKSRLYLEAVLRRTPLAQNEKGLALADRFLLDTLPYQQRPAEKALHGLRPRILIADVVGLGKTLEIGLILAELIRRGRGERILIVTPQQVLEQFQHELWTRFNIPLIRLDSVGLERIQQDIPAGRNPFLYYKRIIISIDTLKNEGKYGQHLDEMDWDAVVIDESHNLIGETSLRNKLAKRLARKTDALLLASATPHNGKAESFAELIRMLDPAAIVDKANYSAKDIEHLYIRRTKVAPEVRDQMGTKWPDRGPSEPVICSASPAEERIFDELTQVWLAGDQRTGGPVVDAKNRLFPYTLLKSFLSSHRALATTVENRLKNATGREAEALKVLGALAAKVSDDDSAKLAALVEQLRQIGVGPRSKTRAVVFSESVPTLEWLRKVVPARLELPDDAVGIMHGGFSDKKQQEIVEAFSLADNKVRVLFTGDVASEGVNLHRECHDMIHYDVPWSLIRIEQRNGRIDRYGQQHQPQFKALILTSEIEGSLDDRTVAMKLIEKEETAHRSLGTAEAVTGQFTAEKEERRLIQDLLDGKTVEESLEENTAPDFLGAMLDNLGFDPENPDPLTADVPSLFDSTEEFTREAIRTLDLLPGLEDDGAMLAFEPPKDLVHRLSALPSAYLRTHDIRRRMRVTFDVDLAQKKLDEARKSKTMWPDIAYLSDLHPLVEWVTDKVLVRLGRQKAPVIVADVAEPTFLIQGVYSNRLGRPTVVAWMAVSGTPLTVQDREMVDVLKDAKVGPGMLNKGLSRDVSTLQDLLAPAVAAARTHLETQRSRYDAEIAETLEPFRANVAVWEQATLDGGVARTTAQREEAKETVEERRHLIDQMETTGEPLLRVLAVLVGEHQ